MYSLGVALAIISGTANNIGILLQKKVVNRIASRAAGQDGRDPGSGG